MSSDAGLSHVIFDCDGVLVDSERLSADVLLSELAAQGLQIDFDYFCAHFMGRSFPTVAADIRKRHAHTLPDDFEATYRARLLAEFQTHLVATSGVEMVLRAIKVPFCVATSSSPKRATNSLRIAGLSDLCPRVFTASEVANGKPAPDLFLYAARQMGATPSRCLVIEDSLPGLAAGLAAGMTVLRYTGGSHLRGRLLKHDEEVQTFDNWSQMPQMFPELFG